MDMVQCLDKKGQGPPFKVMTAGRRKRTENSAKEVGGGVIFV